jgi:hypothetical protein
MRKSLAFVLACSLLAGCAGVPPKPAVVSLPVVAKEAVAVSCVKEIPKAPTFASDKDLLTGSGAQVFDKVWADRLSRRNYEDVLIAVLEACLAPPAATPSK